jgi:hypothetical protein
MSNKNLTFLAYLQNFVDSLTEVFPENRKLFDAYSLYVAEKDQNELIAEFTKHLGKYKQKIMDNDESLFEKDVFLLRGINFRVLWNDKHITDATKKSIWDYLKLLFFLGKMTGENAENDTMNELHEQLKKIAEENKEGENPESAGFDPQKLMDAGAKVKELFGNEDNVVSSLVEDITKEIGKEFGDKKNINLAQLIIKDKSAIQRIVDNVKKTVDDKIAKGEIKEDEMANSAEKVAGVLNSDDIQKKLFGGMDIQKMFASMSPGQMKQMQEMAKGMMPKQEPRINPTRQAKKNAAKQLKKKKS